ncbi:MULTISPECIES: Grx4 family monothiol glutaredoxin [Holospora]|uniref:Glutaredoxin n=2 Tax=Holospora TaxID=44747 RepID=A0A061JIQ1_9PROT|nr:MULTISPECIES: Grx4 family monothiol glutaredoxin [Holospora]ETZ05518.1 monothiol glutaredoxin-S11 [Holospora undulata HU1]GAJ46311.1 monothiol glutaredoxin-S11 [Holospora elegans E1]
MNSLNTQDVPEFYDLQLLIDSFPIMLFMKGSPDHPLCGFSKTVVEILKNYTNDFGFFDVLRDESVRQRIKLFSNWPTFPQLYVNSVLIGGCDIVTLLHKQGSLQETLFLKTAL